MKESRHVEEDHTDDHKDRDDCKCLFHPFLVFLAENHGIIIALFMAHYKKDTKNTFWHSPLMLIILFCILAVFIYNNSKYGLFVNIEVSGKSYLVVDIEELLPLDMPGPLA